MKKKKYEAPQTRYLEVELEGGFCAGSVFKDDEKENLSIDNHVVDETFTFSGVDNEWK